MSSEKHVAILAFPFTSHPLPLPNLLHKLAKNATNVRFSFLNTAKSNDNLFPPSSRARLPPNVVIYDIDDGVPTGDQGRTTEELVEQLKMFFQHAPKSFRVAIDAAEQESGKKVTCLFSDAMFVPACEIAKQMHVPWVVFWVPSPCFLSAFIHIKVFHQHRHRTSCGSMAVAEANDKALEMVPGLSLVRMSDFPYKDTSAMSNLALRMGQVLPQAAAVIMNSYTEANPAPLIADLKSKFKILLHIGCPTVSFSSSPMLTSSDSDPTGCLTWLDTKDPRTVAYISFGTVALPSHAELSALAEALESSRIPFLWSIKEHTMVHLPEGFLERTAANGKIVSWAPQSQVLSHPACGVYMTHCGYNSVFESVAGGVPMICKPFWADNMMNGRLVTEWWGIGVDVEGGTITKSGMMKALDVVLRSEDGKEMRKKVGELRDRLAKAAGPGGSAEADFKALVELISNL